MGSRLERYFEGLLQLWLAVGFCTLASTGRLSWPVAALATAAFAGRGYCYARHLTVRVPSRWLALTLLLYLPVFALDGLALSSNFLDATLHLLVLAGAAKLYAAPSGRSQLTLGLLAVLEVIAAALITASGVFFVLFLLFLALLVATLVAQEMVQAQAAANSPPAAAPTARSGRLLGFSLFLSLGVAAFTVLIFFLLPRTTLGAWSSLRTGIGLSGFSDEVQLGAIAGLQRNDAEVMHIRITGADPPLDGEAVQQILWRGRGLTTFDGRRWFAPDQPTLYATQSGRLEVSPLGRGEPRQTVRYQVTLAPMGSPVLFFPARLLRAATRFPILSWDRSTATLGAAGGSGDAGTSYSGISNLAQWPTEALRTAPPPSSRSLRYNLQTYLQLPDELDPRIRALAHAITAHGAPNDWDRMQALVQYLQSHYQYNLSGLPQGPDPLSTFLFDQPSGDCEYFASALAVMARTLSIPTRVVNGFAMGTYNPLSGEYVVRGRDAHSWVEAYFPAPANAAGSRSRDDRFDRGAWVSFDATPGSASDAAGAWPGMVVDALSSFWQEWIMNYDWIQQASLAHSLQSGLGERADQAWENGDAAASAAWHEISRPRLPAVGDWLWQAGLGGLIVLLGLLAWVWGARRRGWRLGWGGPESSSPEGWASRHARHGYRRFQRHLLRAGCARTPPQTAQELLATVSATHPGTPLVGSAARFIATYEALRFGAPASTEVANYATKLTQQLDQVRRDCSRRPNQVARHFLLGRSRWSLGGRASTGGSGRPLG